MVPRWRLPVYIAVFAVLSGCAAKTREASDDDEGGFRVPTVRMALVKIPLNGDKSDPLKNSDPIERFIPEPVAVAHKPMW